jgi:hypothetical protein
MSTERERFLSGLDSADSQDIQSITAASLRLERALYDREDHGPFLFALRKSLEGVWGHDLPKLDQYGDEEQ